MSHGEHGGDDRGGVAEQGDRVAWCCDEGRCVGGPRGGGPRGGDERGGRMSATVTATTFEDAYARLYPAVVRSAWSICRDLAHAEELAQEAFVRAYRRWSRLERGGYVEPWLHRAVMNLALTAVTRRSRGRQLEMVARDRSPFAPPPEPDTDWLVTTLRRLPRRQREAVFLRVVVDLPEDEVASLMGISVGSVKVHKKRGLDRLRELVDGADEPAVERAPAPVRAFVTYEPTDGRG